MFTMEKNKQTIFLAVATKQERKVLPLSATEGVSRCSKALLEVRKCQ